MSAIFISFHFLCFEVQAKPFETNISNKILCDTQCVYSINNKYRNKEKKNQLWTCYKNYGQNKEILSYLVFMNLIHNI